MSFVKDVMPGMRVVGVVMRRGWWWGFGIRRRCRFGAWRRGRRCAGRRAVGVPGCGFRRRLVAGRAAVLLVTVGDGNSFPSAAYLASDAGLAPTTKSSGTSIHGEHAPGGGNRQLKRAMFLGPDSDSRHRGQDRVKRVSLQQAADLGFECPTPVVDRGERCGQGRDHDVEGASFRDQLDEPAAAGLAHGARGPLSLEEPGNGRVVQPRPEHTVQRRVELGQQAADPVGPPSGSRTGSPGAPAAACPGAADRPVRVSGNRG